MTGVLSGVALVAVVIAVGYVLGRLDVLGAGADAVLARLAFFAATPALLFTTLLEADLGVVFSPSALVSVVVAVLLALAYVTVSRGLWRRPGTEVTIGALAASYVNAGNLGIPILVYVVGSAAPVAPVLLYQLLVMAPIAFFVLDLLTGRRGASPLATALLPLRNPVVAASLAAFAVALSGWEPPALVLAPIEMIAAVAVPVMLLSFGISLRGAPLPGRGEVTGALWLAAGLKVLAGPALAYGLARLVFGLEGRDLLTPVVIAALPTAQNVFVYAMRYGRATALARETILVTTLAAMPVIVVVAARLG
jgi:predicted permease